MDVEYDLDDILMADQDESRPVSASESKSNASSAISASKKRRDRRNADITSRPTERQQKLLEQKPTAGAKDVQYVLGRTLFTKEDKQALLKAVKTHGALNLKVLQQKLPHKTMAEIELYLRHRRLIGEKYPYKRPFMKKYNQHRVLNTDSWVQLMARYKSHLEKDELVHALEMISLYEDHPSPEKCGGVDFKKMYKCLAQLLDGAPLTDMPLQNYALLMSSYEMLHCYKDVQFMDSKWSSFIKNFNSKTVPGQDKEYAEMQKNPLQVGEDKLVMDRKEVDQVELKVELPHSMTTQKSFLKFHPNGFPAEEDLIFNALRTKERPVTSVYRFPQKNVYVKMPYASSEDLLSGRFSFESSTTANISTLWINTDRELPMLTTTIMPEAMVEKAALKAGNDTHILSLINYNSYQVRPKLIRSLPPASNSTRVKFIRLHADDGRFSQLFKADRFEDKDVEEDSSSAGSSADEPESSEESNLNVTKNYRTAPLAD